MHGGKIYGKGMKGVIMDPEDLYIDEEESVLVYGVHGKYKKKWASVVKDNIVCKVFKEHYGVLDWLMCRNRAPESFRREITGMRRLIKIFGEDNIEKYTTVPVAVLGIVRDGSYIVFTKICEAQVDDIKLNADDMQKLIRQTLSCVAVLQNHNLVHCDLKPGNILKCGDDFKIIDWELMHKLDWKTSQQYSGDVKFTSPFAYALQGVSVELCLERFVAHCDRKWRQSRLFRVCLDIIARDLEKVGRIDATVFKNHKYHFDMFSLGLTFAYLLFKNKIRHECYLKLIRGLVSLYGFKDASAAFRVQYST